MSAARARRLPLFPTLQNYQTSWLTGDVIAGLTLVAIAIPEQMATARLANMPALTGLYAFVVGSLMIIKNSPYSTSLIIAMIIHEIFVTLFFKF